MNWFSMAKWMVCSVPSLSVISTLIIPLFIKNISSGTISGRLTISCRLNVLVTAWLRKSFSSSSETSIICFITCLICSIYFVQVVGSFRVWYHCRKRSADLRWAGFLPLMLMRSTKLSATTKLSAEHETPPIANVLLCVRANPCLMHNCLKFDFSADKNWDLIWCIGINVILKMLY